MHKNVGHYKENELSLNILGTSEYVKGIDISAFTRPPTNGNS